MKLYTQSCYNPFFVEVGGKAHEINNIHFFDSDGVICSTGHGWFGSNNYFRDGLEIAVDCIVKRNVDYTTKTAFLVASSEKSWATGKTRYALYIPAAVVGVKTPTINRPRHSIRYFIVEWKTDVQGVFCTTWRWVDAALSVIEGEINEIGEEIKSLFQDKFSKLPELLKRLQKLEKQRKRELEAMEQITPESILIEYERKNK